MLRHGHTCFRDSCSHRSPARHGSPGSFNLTAPETPPNAGVDSVSHLPDPESTFPSLGCDTWSETRCAPDSRRAPRTGDREVCTNARGMPVGRCWTIGRCRNPPTGRSTSICPKKKRNLRPSAATFVAAAPTAMARGPNARSNNSGCSCTLRFRDIGATLDELDDGDTDVTRYEWDFRNRLTRVAHRNTQWQPDTWAVDGRVVLEECLAATRPCAGGKPSKNRRPPDSAASPRLRAQALR